MSVAVNEAAGQVQEGVFFAPPKALPRGRHNLSREQVQAAQQERMMVAATELLAAEGYGGFGPADIASRAGVSLAAFYDCFENKDACVFAGYDRFIEILLGRMTSQTVQGLGRAAIVHTMLGAYLETLQQDLVVARAYQVEIDALGPAARHRRRESLRLFGQFLSALVAQITDGDPPAALNESAYIGVVYAARQLASDALDESPEPDLLDLARRMEPWLEDLFRER